MDIVFKLLLWVHLASLIAGGAGSIVMPLLGRQIAGAPAEARQRLVAVGDRVSMASRGALVVLLITGPILFWLKWQFIAPDMIWFTIKMLLVLVLLIGVIVAGINAKRAQSGDVEAGKRVQMLGRINGLALLGIILSAVFAFN